MRAETRFRLVDVWDPRQAKKVKHDLIELLVIAVCAVLAGADTFVLKCRHSRSTVDAKDIPAPQKNFGKMSLLQPPPRHLLRRSIRPWGAICVVREVLVSERQS
mgnify:CR=1 FL=1